MFNKKGVELSVNLMIKLIIGLMILLLLLFVLMKYGGGFFQTIGAQLSNANSSLADLEIFK
tara:strand:- start:635 stop:817 length:183 start_codon:yes stop_codon:yes gene_type:complete